MVTREGRASDKGKEGNGRKGDREEGAGVGGAQQGSGSTQRPLPCDPTVT